MTITMRNSCTITIQQMEEFLQGSSHLNFLATTKQETYTWISEQVNYVKYFTLKKKRKGIAINYLKKISGYSTIQVKKLLRKKRTSGHLKVSPMWGKKHSFKKKYTDEDIFLLSETDHLHQKPAGQSLQATMKRMYEKFGDPRYARLQHISLGHIYNLRSTDRYKEKSLHLTKTHPVKVPIGIRKKPQNGGKPGFLRVDSVHQGDQEGCKGVYHINLVDEVTQWELILCVEKISEYFLLPALESALRQFPFKILNFHSDNGSEYINYQVANMLDVLMVKQTKSRSRHSNDNGLAETKNGSVVRKHMGYTHIPKVNAKKINIWYDTYFHTYLNFHRPCGFATVTTDKKGKEKKKYDMYLTPYEKLETLDNWTQYLVEGWTKEKLDTIATAKSDNEWARQMQEAKRILFKSFTTN